MQRQFAALTAKIHLHGILNPRAQYRVAKTVEGALGDTDVVHPLTPAMCAPIVD